MRIGVLFLSLTMLGACGGTNELMVAMRDDHVSLFDTAAFSVPQETELTREAIALEEQISLLHKLARMSAAERGCLSDDTRRGCASELRVGQWVNRFREVGPVDLQAITPVIASTHTQMTLVAEGTQTMLDAQSREIAQIRLGREDGSLDDVTASARMAEIAQSREAVADALSLAAERSDKVVRTLTKARDGGQSELDFYLRAVSDVGDRSRAVAGLLRDTL